MNDIFNCINNYIPITYYVLYKKIKEFNLSPEI